MYQGKTKGRCADRHSGLQNESAGFVAAAEVRILHIGLVAVAVSGHFDLGKIAFAAVHVVGAGRNITGYTKIFHTKDLLKFKKAMGEMGRHGNAFGCCLGVSMR